MDPRIDCQEGTAELDARDRAYQDRDEARAFDDRCSRAAAHGEPSWWVAVYSVERYCGGREEGGWWYDAGTLVAAAPCVTEAEARGLAERWAEFWPTTDRRYSVLGGEDHDIQVLRGTVADAPPLGFPEERPFYE